MSDFPGKIARTVAESTPWWPQPNTDAQRRPNIVTIVLDDTGWSDIGAFGSEINTPAIDAIAERGVRYSNFHVTPLCSPTRASMLSGLNHHAVGMSCLADTDTGFPNSRGAVRQDVPLLPRLLSDAGYGTYMVGKWHLTPMHEITAAGPYRNWPVGRGFDNFYGFLGGCTDQLIPELCVDNTMIDPPTDEGYHLSEDLTNRAIKNIRDHETFRPNEPFFLNLAFGATHAPFQVDRSYIDPYIKIFEKGWDQTRTDRLARQKELGVIPQDTVLAERNPEVPAWDSLSAEQQLLYTHLQAAYAGFLEHTDDQIARLVAELKRLDLLDNTLIVVISDNGASREGGEHGAVNTNANYSGQAESVAEQLKKLDKIGGVEGPAFYPQGWAMAGNTPFRRYKQFVELGGVRSPLIVSWPKGIKSHGELRDQFLHVIDLAPTIMSLAGSRRAATFDGRSFESTFADATAPAPRSIQYWEMFGRRAIFANGWKAVSQHEKGDAYAEDQWSLYDTTSDFSEAHNIASQHPDKLKELIALWWKEAEANEVMPLDDRTLVDVINFRQPNGIMSQKQITYQPGQSHISQTSMVTATERSMEITAHFRESLSANQAEGVLVSSGDRQGGYTLYIQNGELRFEHVWLGNRVVLSGKLPNQFKNCRLTLDVQEDNSAEITIWAEDALLDSGKIQTVTGHPSFWGLDIGRDVVSTVSASYAAPFAFPETLLDRVFYNFARTPTAQEVATRLETTE